MKILVVSQYFYPENFRVNSLCCELVKRGNDVTVLTGYPNYPQGVFYDGYGWNKPYEREWNGVHIERVRMRARGKTPLGLLANTVSFVRAGRRWVREHGERYDACYVFEVSPVTVALPALSLREKTGTPVFFNVQDLWPDNVEVILGVKNKLILGYLDRLVDKIYAGCDRILCASRSFVENIAARGVPREKLVYWPQFCDEPDLAGAKFPAEYDRDSFRVVFTGNIGAAQGLDAALDAAALLRQRGVADVKWYIVGDGRERAALESRAAELGLGDSVVFTGRRPESEMASYISGADCALLTLMSNRIFEMTIPAKLQTYMSCAAPVLAAAGGEVANIVAESGSGIVSAPGDPAALCDAVLSLRDMGPQRRAEMGRAARGVYEREFTKQKLVDRLLEMFAAAAR